MSFALQAKTPLIPLPHLPPSHHLETPPQFLFPLLFFFFRRLSIFRLLNLIAGSFFSSVLSFTLLQHINTLEKDEFLSC